MLDTFTIIKTVGIIGVFLIVFLESGVFFGFFLPGDSLLFTAGILSALGFLPVYLLLIGCMVAAMFGNIVGYFTGSHFGIKLFSKEDNIFFKKKYLKISEEFYNKHGAYTIFFARFIPFVRTFAPIVAGIGKMNKHKFMIYNILGAIFWPISMFSIGYFFGSKIQNIEKYMSVIIILIILISLIPIFIKFFLKKSSIKNKIGV